MGSAIAKPLPEILEKEWDATLFSLTVKNPGLAVRLGWKSYHTLRSRGSASGYPDRTLWKGRVIFVETKRELSGKKSEDANRQPSPKQVEVLDGLARAGAEVYLWRPSDLDEIARILGRPWDFAEHLHPSKFSPSEKLGDYDYGRPPHLAFMGAAEWIPRSIWIPGRGRADEAGIVP